MRQKLAAYNGLGTLSTRLEYELVDETVCPGIHKTRLRPATMSAVAT